MFPTTQKIRENNVEQKKINSIQLDFKPFYIEDFGEACGFYNRRNRIECEGERQKYCKYINVFTIFRFLSSTKLNRNEQARYSVAHPIQPLCLGGVGTCPVLRV